VATAEAINDKGGIVGYGTDTLGNTRDTCSVPEPRTADTGIGVIAGGAGAMAS
jgi:hypothetical protein